MLQLTLKAARVNKGLTQKAVAERLKVSNKTVCAWENGTSFPNALQVQILCEIYEVAYDNLKFLPNNPL